ncbi:MAG: ABC transporter substrate-binding protein [Candidatus Peribacteraceae bacterium]|nr:ABC transporter substrate-binding protein [Candidatus Peribacteraceae bacterium]
MKNKIQYESPRILSVIVSPDITKCMQNTGGIDERSTFNLYKKHIKNTNSASNSEKLESSKKIGSTAIISRSILTLTLVVLVFSSILFSQISTEQPVNIPILIPQEHPVINEIVDGINEGFKELGYSEPQFKTIVMDGQGVPANISTMIDAAIQKTPEIIITITTGLSKTTVDKVLGAIPVVFSGVTDPVGAGIVEDMEKHGNVTGASDLWPVEDQLRLIKRVLPDVKSVGILFRPSEPNSQFGIKIAREAANKLGINLVERGVEDSKEIVAVLDAILTQVDAIYIGPDNMTIESAKIIIESSMQARKPVFGGEPGTLEKGAVGVVSINYFDHGRETAKLCHKILKNTSASRIPVYVSKKGFIGLNYESATLLNISIPENVRNEAKNTVGQYSEPENNEKNNIFLIWGVLAFIMTLIVLILVFKTKKNKSENI